MKTRNMALAMLFGCTAISSAVMAADAPKDGVSSPAVMDRDARMKKWSESKDELEKALGTGKDKAFYRKTLEDKGYFITAVNKDESDYLEYEVVKGGETYEVQVDFDNGKSSKVDVTTNVWKADATERALKDKNYSYTYPATVSKNYDKVSDRVRSKAFAGEKASLEKSLGTGHDRSYYRPALEKMGYKVTSVTENDPDNLELEIVKGDTSYEVQVDFDSKTKKSKAVDVSTNIWETERTERAKGE